MRLTIIRMVLAWLAMHSGSALAICGASDFEAALPATISIDAGSVAVGGALTEWVSSPTLHQGLHCGNHTNYVAASSHVTGDVMTGTGTYTEGGRTFTVYPTGVAGVGVVIDARDQNQGWNSVVASSSKRLVYWCCNAGVILRSYARVRYIRTGDLVSGNHVVNRMRVAAIMIVAFSPSTGQERGRADAGIWLGSTRFQITGTSPTCRVTPNNNQPVRLGSIQVGSFSGVGSASPQVSFPIRLDCAGGAAGNTANVFAVLTDATNTANRSDRLTLTSGSGARGVAIQILKDGSVLSYGPDSSAAGTANQWRIATLGNQTHTFNLAARYVQTAATITPGSANGTATITLSYQ